MKTNKFLASFILLMGLSAHAQVKAANSLEENIVRKAIAVNELSQSIGTTVTELKSAVTYKNRTEKFGAQIFKVELKYKLVWSSGYSMQTQEYVVLLRSSGSSEVYSDSTYFLKDLAQAKYADFEARKEFSLETFSDGMMSAQFGQFMLLAQTKAEAFVAAKAGLKVISSQTLVSGLNSQFFVGKNLAYRFEVVTASPELNGKKIRQHILIIVNPETTKVEVFEEDPQYNSLASAS